MGKLREGHRAARWVLAGLVPATLVLLVLSVIPSASATMVSAAPATSAVGPGSDGIASLQAAIDSAPAGTTIHLPAGIFIGQLHVDKSVNLVGAGVDKTILQSPASMEPDDLGNVFVVEIGHDSTVAISKLTVRVTEQCMLANSIGVATGGGVGVRDASTLNIWDVSAVAFGPYPDLNQPCTTHGSPGMLSFGRAISIGLDDPHGTVHQLQGHGTVERVLTDGFDIFSISVGGVAGPSGSTATITDNTVRVGPGPYTAAYGIVVYGTSVVTDNLVTGEAGSDGGIAVVFTSAVVTGNSVENFTCTTAPFPITPTCGVDPFYNDQDLGIFLASVTPGTIVQHNSIVASDSGILVEGPGAPAVISHNSISASTFYGLELINGVQAFRLNDITGGLYVVAVGAESSNTTAILAHDTYSYSVAVGLLQANYPFVAKLIVY
jgi:hypothetical protein